MSLYRESIHLFIFLSYSVLLLYSGYSYISVVVYMLDGLLPMKKRFSVIAPLPARIVTICPSVD